MRIGRYENICHPDGEFMTTVGMHDIGSISEGQRSAKGQRTYHNLLSQARLLSAYTVFAIIWIDRYQLRVGECVIIIISFPSW